MINRILTSVSILILSCSCTKYLDIKPYGQAIPQTPEEFSALLQYHLEAIENGGSAALAGPSVICNYECYADNLEANLTEYPKGNYIPLYIGNNSDVNGFTTAAGSYASLYAIIRDCNIIIGYMEEKESRLAKDVLGTSYAMRGVCYYNLLRMYCEPCVNNPDGLGVPLVTEFDMEARPVRSTISKTAEQIEKDLLKALSYDISDETYIFNNDVIKGYLARMYFWTGDFKEAAIYAGEVVTAHPLLSGESYKEMIGSHISKKGNILIKSFILSGSSANAQYNGSIGTTQARPVSRRFTELFKADGDRDIRQSISFNNKRVFTKSVLSCMRSAEMQLILAESLYHEGDMQGALNALNRLRRHRIEGVTDYTMESLPAKTENGLIVKDVYGNPLTPLLCAILCERQKELFMEGDRWYELKRNGRPEFWAARQGRKYTTMRFMYTFPIPISDMNLTKGMVQNPGYDKTR